MKRPGLRQRIYDQYALLKKEGKTELHISKDPYLQKEVAQLKSETRQTIKWRSKGY